MIIKNLNNITKDIKNKGLRMLLLASNLEYAIKKYNCPDIYLGNIINTVGDNGAHLEIEFIEKTRLLLKKW